jgi:hypothetical protein
MKLNQRYQLTGRIAMADSAIQMDAARMAQPKGAFIGRRRINNSSRSSAAWFLPNSGGHCAPLPRPPSLSDARLVAKMMAMGEVVTGVKAYPE